MDEKPTSEFDMAQNECLMISYGNIFPDPPQRQTVLSLARNGWRVTVLQLTNSKGLKSNVPAKVSVVEVPDPWLSQSWGMLHRLSKWRRFNRAVRRWIEDHQPGLVWTYMLHGLAALPKPAKPYRVVSFIPDIPSLADVGRFDRHLIKRGWKRLGEADVIWASDIYKARLAQEYGQLPQLPIVCHNCPTLDYLPEPTWPRDGWLRSELRRQNAALGSEGGCILLRAGAVGEWGGIEATLAVMPELPNDYVFLMMGRPPEDYKAKILRLITELGLRNRAFFWDRPSDEIWKKALCGADISHLIHGPFSPGRATRLYELNSSLSNNRLFQSTAAGLPIIAYDDPRMNFIYEKADCFRVARLAQLKEDIKRIWEELGRQSELRQSLGQAGYQTFRTEFHWEKQFAPVLEKIREFLPTH